MKHQKSKIWQKKRHKKYKKAQKVVTPVPKDKQPAITPTVKKSSFFETFSLKNRNKKTYKKEEEQARDTKQKLKEWLRKNDSDIQLILFPLILLVILLILYFFNDQLFLTVSQDEPLVVDQINLHPYPYLQAVSSPTISAKTAIIVDRDSQVILFSKNPQLRFSIASTTKIMTSMVALDHYNLDDILTVKRASVPGSGLNLTMGEQFRFIDLMYAMLLPSANDAAQAIADNYPGGVDAFVRQMNAKAQSLHLNSTHYADPIGLDDDGDYSTVVDMARLSSYAISSPMFAQITSTKYKTIYSNNSTRSYQLINTNELLGIDGVTGIKTGTTEGAKEVLVTSVVKNAHTYIIVVMDSEDRFGDTTKLLNFLDTNVKYIIPPAPIN